MASSSPSPSSETSTMSTFILCVTFFLLGFVCVSMLYNGNRLSVHVVNRWIVSLKEEDEKDVKVAPEPANRNHGRHVPRPSTPRVPRSTTRVPRSLRPSRPPVPGCQYEPFQYKIDLSDKDFVKGIKTTTFTMDLYPYAARPKIKCPSVLSEMSESHARRISICKSTLSSYDFTIDSLRQALSKKGKAYHDVDHPVMLKFEYRSEGNRVYTSLLVYHANTYCVCFRACDKWRVFEDSPYELKDQNGNLAENIHLNSAYPSGAFDYVGAITIIEALKCLNTDLGNRSKRPWKKACLHLVYCFIEASKFRDIEHYVRGALEKSMMEDLYASK